MKSYKFPIKYTSLNIIKTKKNKITNKITKNNLLSKEDIKKKFVVIKVEFANLNYKDFLMSQGHSGLIKKFPHTPGIDACGTVFYSNSKKFKKNERVFVISHPLGVDTNGSFSEYITVPDNALKIEVVAYQWGWNYRLPGDDGILGKTSIKLISDENPYGLDSNDPNSKDDILVMDADLHLEINQPVKVELRSLDVLHNFYVPQFRAKMDTLPGIITYYWFIPEKTGDYEILCAEYCGTGHYAMRGKVLVDEEKDYSNWLAQQMTFEKMLAKNSLEKNLLIAENKN